ncbi:MAG: hypothetical protein FWF08_08920 [Oscillospiraceae bacterium]|nr:hypothetical protein [Oscillospiraceae bacterium]
MDLKKLNVSDNFKTAVSERIKAGRMPHAVLITGTNAAARSSAAAFLAAAALCASENENEKPCDKCPDCVKCGKGVHPDIFKITGTDKPQSIKIGDIREIKAKSYILPNEARAKVFIIEEASGMGDVSQNAFLKILEEPPYFTCFILTAESESVFLPTILSRVTVFSTGEAGNAGKEKKAEQKAVLAASEIINRMLEGDEYGIMAASAPLAKDKLMFKRCAAELSYIFRDALRYGEDFEMLSSGNADIEAVSRKIKRDSLLKLLKKMSDLLDYTDKNANDNLLLTKLSIEIKIHNL